MECRRACIARRHSGREKALHAVNACLDQLYVISVGTIQLEAASKFGERDYEDNLQLACALSAQLDAIVTRDPSGFDNSKVDVLTTSELLKKLRARD